MQIEYKGGNPKIETIIKHLKNALINQDSFGVSLLITRLENLGLTIEVIK